MAITPPGAGDLEASLRGMFPGPNDKRRALEVQPTEHPEPAYGVQPTHVPGDAQPLVPPQPPMQQLRQQFAYQPTAPDPRQFSADYWMPEEKPLQPVSHPGSYDQLEGLAVPRYESVMPTVDPQEEFLKEVDWGQSKPEEAVANMRMRIERLPGFEEKLREIETNRYQIWKDMGVPDVLITTVELGAQKRGIEPWEIAELGRDWKDYLPIGKRDQLLKQARAAEETLRLAQGVPGLEAPDPLPGETYADYRARLEEQLGATALDAPLQQGVVTEEAIESERNELLRKAEEAEANARMVEANHEIYRDQGLNRPLSVRFDPSEKYLSKIRGYEEEASRLRRTADELKAKRPGPPGTFDVLEPKTARTELEKALAEQQRIFDTPDAQFGGVEYKVKAMNDLLDKWGGDLMDPSFMVDWEGGPIEEDQPLSARQYRRKALLASATTQIRPMLDRLRKSSEATDQITLWSVAGLAPSKYVEMVTVKDSDGNLKTVPRVQEEHAARFLAPVGWETPEEWAERMDKIQTAITYHTALAELISHPDGNIALDAANELARQIETKEAGPLVRLVADIAGYDEDEAIEDFASGLRDTWRIRSTADEAIKLEHVDPDTGEVRHDVHRRAFENVTGDLAKRIISGEASVDDVREELSEGIALGEYYDIGLEVAQDIHNDVTGGWDTYKNVELLGAATDVYGRMLEYKNWEDTLGSVDIPYDRDLFPDEFRLDDPEYLLYMNRFVNSQGQLVEGADAVAAANWSLVHETLGLSRINADIIENHQQGDPILYEVLPHVMLPFFKNYSTVLQAQPIARMSIFTQPDAMPATYAVPLFQALYGVRDEDIERWQSPGFAPPRNANTDDAKKYRTFEALTHAVWRSQPALVAPTDEGGNILQYIELDYLSRSSKNPHTTKGRLTIEQATNRWNLSRWKWMASVNTILMESTLPPAQRSPGVWRDIEVDPYEQARRFVGFVRDSDVVADSAFRAQVGKSKWFTESGARQFPVNDSIITSVIPQTSEYWQNNQRHDRIIGYNIFAAGGDVQFDPARGSVEVINSPMNMESGRKLQGTIDLSDSIVQQEQEIATAGLVQAIAHDTTRGYGIPVMSDTHAIINGVWKYKDSDIKYQELIKVMEESDDETGVMEFFRVHVPYSFNRMVRGMYLLTKESLGYLSTGFNVAAFSALSEAASWWEDDPMEHFEEFKMPNGKIGFRAKAGSKARFSSVNPMDDYLSTNETLKALRGARDEAKATFVRKSFTANEAMREMIKFYAETYTDWDKFKGYLAHDPIPAILDVASVFSMLGWTGPKGVRASRMKETRHTRLDRAQAAIRRRQRSALTKEGRVLSRTEQIIMEGGDEARAALGMDLEGTKFADEAALLKEGLTEAERKAFIEEHGNFNTTEAFRTYGDGVSLRNLPQRFVHEIGDFLVNRRVKRLAAGAEAGVLQYNWGIRLLAKTAGLLDSNVPVLAPVLHDMGRFLIKEAASGSKTGMIAQYFLNDRSYMSRDVRAVLALGEQQSNLIIQTHHAKTMSAIKVAGKKTLHVDRIPTVEQIMRFSSKEALLDKTGSAHTFKTKKTGNKRHAVRVGNKQVTESILKDYDNFHSALESLADGKLVEDIEWTVRVNTAEDPHFKAVDVDLHDLGLADKPRRVRPSKLSEKEYKVLHSISSDFLKQTLEWARKDKSHVQELWVSRPNKKAVENLRGLIKSEGRKQLTKYMEEVHRGDIRMAESGPFRLTSLVNMPKRLPDGTFIELPVLLEDAIKLQESPAFRKAGEDYTMLIARKGEGHLDSIAPGGEHEFNFTIRAADVTVDGVSVGSGPDYMAQASPEVISVPGRSGAKYSRVKQPDGTYVVEVDWDRVVADWSPPKKDPEIYKRLKREYKEAISQEVLEAAQRKKNLVEHEGILRSPRTIEYIESTRKLDEDIAQAESYLSELEDLHLRRDEARKAGQPDPDTGQVLVKTIENEIARIKERIATARVALKSAEAQIKTTPQKVYRAANRPHQAKLKELRAERKEVLKTGATKQMDMISMEQDIQRLQSRVDDLTDQISQSDIEYQRITDPEQRKEINAERKMLSDERRELAKQVKEKQEGLDKIRPSSEVMKESFAKLEELKEKRAQYEKTLNTEPVDSPAFEVAEAHLRRIDEQIEAAKQDYDAAKLRDKHGITPKEKTKGKRVPSPKGKLPRGVRRDTPDAVVSRVREIDAAISELQQRMDRNKSAAHDRWPAEKARVEEATARLKAEMEGLENARAQRIRDLGRADEAVFDLDKELRKVRTRRTRAKNKRERLEKEYQAERLEEVLEFERRTDEELKRQHPARKRLREYIEARPRYMDGTDIHAPIADESIFPSFGEYQDFITEYARVDASMPRPGQKGYRVGQTRAQRQAAVTEEALSNFREGRAGLPDPGRVRDAKGKPVEFHLLDGPIKEAVRGRAYKLTLEDLGLVRKQGMHWVATDTWKAIMRQNHNEWRLANRGVTTPSGLSTLMKHVGNILSDGRGLTWVADENLSVHAGFLKQEVLPGSMLQLNSARGKPKLRQDALALGMKELSDALGLKPVFATTEPALLEMIGALYKVDDVKAWRKGLPKTESRVSSSAVVDLSGNIKDVYNTVKAANKQYSLVYEMVKQADGSVVKKPITLSDIATRIKKSGSDRKAYAKLLKKHVNTDRVMMGYDMRETALGRIMENASQDTKSLLKVIDEASHKMMESKVGRGDGEKFTAELEQAWRVSRATSLSRLKKNPMAAVRLAFGSMTYQERLAWMSWMQNGVLPEIALKKPKILSTWERVGLVDLVDGKPNLTPLGATSTMFTLDHTSHFYQTMFLRAILEDAGQFAGAYNTFFNPQNYVNPRYAKVFEMVTRSLNDVQSGLAMDWVRHINALGIENSPSAISNALTHWSRVYKGTFEYYLRSADPTQKIAKSITTDVKNKRMAMMAYYDAQLKSGKVVVGLTPHEAAMFARLEINSNMYRVETIKKFFDEGYIAPGRTTVNGDVLPPTDDGGWMPLNVNELIGKKKQPSWYQSGGRLDPTAPKEAQAAHKHARKLMNELAANEFRYYQHLDQSPDFDLRYIFGDLAELKDTYFIRRTQAKVINLENRVQSSFIKHQTRKLEKFYVVDKLRGQLAEASGVPLKDAPLSKISPEARFWAGAGLGYAAGSLVGMPYLGALTGGVAGVAPVGVATTPFIIAEGTYKAADWVNKNILTKAFKTRKLFQSFVGPMARNMMTNTLLQWTMDPKMMFDPVWKKHYKDYWAKYRNGILDTDLANELASLDIVQAGMSKEIGFVDHTRLSVEIDSWLSEIYNRADDYANYLEEGKALIDTKFNADVATQMSIDMGMVFEQGVLEGKIMPDAMKRFQDEAARAHTLPPNRTLSHKVRDVIGETRQAFAPIHPFEGLNVNNRFLRWGKNAFNHTDDSFKYAYAGYLYEVEGLRGQALRARVFEKWPDYSNITDIERMYTLKQAFGVYQTKYYNILTKFMVENPLQSRALMLAHEMYMAAELSDPETYEEWLNLPAYRKWMSSRYPMGWLDESAFSVMGVERFETTAWNNPIVLAAALLYDRGSMYAKGLDEGHDSKQLTANFLRTITDLAYGSSQIHPWELAFNMDMIRDFKSGGPSLGDTMGNDAKSYADDFLTALSQSSGPRTARAAAAAAGEPYRIGADRAEDSVLENIVYNTLGLRTTKPEPDFINKVRGKLGARQSADMRQIRSLLKGLEQRSARQRLDERGATTSVRQELDFRNRLDHIAKLQKLYALVEMGVDRPNALRIIKMARRLMMKRLREPAYTIGGQEYRHVEPPPGWRTDEDIHRRMLEIQSLRVRQEQQRALREIRNEQLMNYFRRWNIAP